MGKHTQTVQPIQFWKCCKFCLTPNRSIFFFFLTFNLLFFCNFSVQLWNKCWLEKKEQFQVKTFCDRISVWSKPYERNKHQQRKKTLKWMYCDGETHHLDLCLWICSRIKWFSWFVFVVYKVNRYWFNMYYVSCIMSTQNKI